MWITNRLTGLECSRQQIAVILHVMGGGDKIVWRLQCEVLAGGSGIGATQEDDG